LVLAVTTGGNICYRNM